MNSFGCAEKQSIVVWNPSIRRYSTIPSTRFPEGTHLSCIWFGFDLISKDYKVIRTITFKKQKGVQTTPPPSPMTEVYALGSGCWKAISSACPFHFLDTLLYEQVYTNGACLRIVLKGLSSSPNDRHILLLSIDLGDEVCRVIDTPVEMDGSYSAGVSIRLIQDMVSVFRVKEGEWLHCLVWVMRDYGVVESWAKQYSFNYGGDLDFSMWRIDETLFACHYVETLALLGGSRMDLLVTTHCGDFDLLTLLFEGREGGGEDEGSVMAAHSVAIIVGTIVEFLLSN